MPLDFFRGIDQSKFEWVDKDEILPGETTCGFLNAPLGWPNGSDGWHADDDDVIFPNVSVYICVKFAKVQPAPRGNLAVHCGGPGSLSGCVHEMSARRLGVDAHDTYNIISFDQRGMGRSKPTFLVDECDTSYYDLCYYDPTKMAEEEAIRAQARCRKARILGCWKYPGFRLESEDDSDKMYHFLEYSGTRQLAEDIERVRILFGGQKLSIFGVSYGTKVFGTYATIFPKNVGLMVLDSNSDPGSDIVSYTEDFARSNNQRIDYFIASCEFSSECHVPNMRGCINRLDRIFNENQDDLLATFGSQAKRGTLMQDVMNLLFKDYDQVDGICDAAKEGDYDQVKAIIQDMLESSQDDDVFSLLKVSRDGIDRNSKPTLDAPNTISVALVGGQDYAFGAYDEDLYVRSILEWRDKYPCAGTRVADRRSWYGVSYFFPNVTPLAPIGNPQIRGIIAGQIYDPATSYIWTQKMRERFPLATLLTSRSVNHGMHSSRLHDTWDPVCLGHIQRYFKTGVVDIVDGHVCESEPIGDSCTINDILAGKFCLKPKAGGGSAAALRSVFHPMTSLNVFQEPDEAVGLRKKLAGWAEDSVETYAESFPLDVAKRTDEGDPVAFEPAMPLDFFRDIDESKFTWLDKNEIRQGETTCGFLNAPLGWPNGSSGWHEDGDDDAFPHVSVYVCVKFAEVQPAPRGNLAVHCGGPGSLSACVYSMELGDAHDTYNIIGFDQRGMGRSKPTFVVEECTPDHYDECHVDTRKMTEEEEIRAHARCYKARILGCWAYPEFRLESEDDSGKIYHFLEYSGTRQLAEDIERVRILFGDQKLSIYGQSYGTTVFGTYATIFPKNVGLMVLDSNSDPGSDIVSNAEDVARSNSQRIDYFIASCEFTSECHVPNMRGCINRLNRMIDANQDDISDLMKAHGEPDRKGTLMRKVILLLFMAYDQVDGICGATEEGDYLQVKAIIRDMLERFGGDYALLKVSHDDDDDDEDEDNDIIDSESKPTSGQNDTWPFAKYKKISSARSSLEVAPLRTALVGGQDYAFGAYDEDLYVRSILEWRSKYHGAGTRVGDKGSWYGVAYFFPNVTPLAPIGNPQIRGIIAGQIYDPATPYIWTQKMRERFPLATLLTSRSVNHGMEFSMLHGTEDPACQGHIQRYFKTGVVDIIDGHVCESESIGDSCTINDILLNRHRCTGKFTVLESPLRKTAER